MPKSKHKKSKNKHDRICRELSDKLEDSSSYNSIETNVEYELGECDVLAKNCKRQVYYEVKGNYSQKAYNRAMEQLERWTEYKYRKDNSKNYYGVLYTPQRIILMYKNGYRRN